MIADAARYSIIDDETTSDDELIDLFMDGFAPQLTRSEKEQLRPTMLRLKTPGLEAPMNPRLLQGLRAAEIFFLRRYRAGAAKICEPRDAWPFLRHIALETQERFYVLSLNAAHEVIELEEIARGLVNSCPIHPREVFRSAIVKRACTIIVAHNHPSGHCSPSKQDRSASELLAKSGQLLGIPLLDHLIVTRRDIFSFREHGFL